MGRLLLEHPVARVTLQTRGSLEIIRLEGRMFPTAAQVRDFMPKYTELVKQHAPARVVTDLRQFSEAPLSVRVEYAKFLGALRPYVARAAIFGLRPSTGALVRLVLKLAGRSDIWVASTEAQALDWVVTGPVEKAG